MWFLIHAVIKVKQYQTMLVKCIQDILWVVLTGVVWLAKTDTKDQPLWKMHEKAILRTNSCSCFQIRPVTRKNIKWFKHHINNGRFTWWSHSWDQRSIIDGYQSKRFFVFKKLIYRDQTNCMSFKCVSLVVEDSWIQFTIILVISIVETQYSKGRRLILIYMIYP